MTAGQVLVNALLPEDLRDYKRVLDKKAARDLSLRLAKEHPDKFADVMQKLYRFGAFASRADGATLSLGAFEIPEDARKMRDEVKKRVVSIVNDDSLDDKKRAEKITAALVDSAGPLEKTLYDSALREENPFAIQILSGSRGGKGDLRSLLAGDFAVQDHRGNVVPIPMLHGYSEGLSPAEYFAGAYGARTGAYFTKFMTAAAGFLGKQLVQGTHRQLVTEKDCGTSRYISVDAQDPDNDGVVLAEDTKQAPAGTVLSKRLWEGMGDRKIKVRSPLTCEAHRGVCSRCVGIRETGQFPKIGDNVGVAAAQSLTEKISQGSLSMKHCLFEDEQVRMGDWSTKAIRDIRIGDVVMGVDESGVIRKTTVTAVYDNGEREVNQYDFRELSTRNRRSLRCTSDHQIFSSSHTTGQKEDAFNNVPRMLPVGWRLKTLYAVGTSGFDDAGMPDSPWAMLIGCLLGDGCYTESVGSVNISQDDRTMIDELGEIIRPLNLKLTKLGSPYYWKVSMIEDDISKYRKTDGSGTMMTGSRNPARQFLEKHGMYGKYAHEKTIPECAYGWSNKSVSELIGGLIVTDGSIISRKTDNGVTISLGSTSLRMLQQVQELLEWRFGIFSAVVLSGKSGSGGRKHDVYVLNVSHDLSVRRFERVIPLIGVKKGRIKEKVAAMRVITKRDRKEHRLLRAEVTPMGLRRTFDIQVDLPSHRFLTAEGLVVSNSGGRAAAGDNKVKGFDLFNQLIQVPSSFKDKAPLAPVDGIVRDVVPAPQGGFFVDIEGQKMHVPSGQKVTVKAGQRMEAGDLLSDGIPNPAEMAEHKGIGVARQTFVEQFRDGFRRSGMNANRRNIELVARGLVNHVKITDLEGPGTPGDIAEYDEVARNWEPRKGSYQVPGEKSAGRWLEKAEGPFTIGTRITPRVAETLKGVPITVHDQPPPFQPKMVRAMENLSRAPDWRVRLGGSYLERGLMDAVNTGASSNRSESYIPGMAEGQGFGEDLETTGIY